MPVQYSYTSTPLIGRTACTQPQCLYSTAIPLLPLLAVRPVQILSACTRMHFTFVGALLHINTKSVTAHNKRHKTSQPTSLHFATPLQKSRVFRLSCSPRLFMPAAPRQTVAGNSSAVFTFVLLNSPFVQPHKRNKKKLDFSIYLSSSVTIQTYTRSSGLVFSQ
jgi:hypothetical protein